jgi:hypothetical protein
MDYVGIDLNKKESQICILSEGGQLSECRIPTEPRSALAEPLCRTSDRFHPPRVPGPLPHSQ